MTGIQRVLIVRHPDDAFDATPYIMRVLAEEWRRGGLRVDVTCRPDVATAGPETLVVPHLDLTRTPEAYQRFFARCPLVLNRRVSDISKRRVSRNLVSPLGDYDGAVIVKTNHNAGGDQERDKLRRNGRFGRKAWDVARRLPWTISGFIGPGEYKIYDHPVDVPWPVWFNPRLVVEKFLPERQGNLYCLRQYVFFASREINALSLSPDPLVKSWTITKREILPETPAAVRELRRQLGFDFGKFDYVIRDGRVVLFDANRTPTYNPTSQAGSASRLVLDLAGGLDALGMAA